MKSDRVSKKRTFRAEREFGLVVGGVLMFLSLWWIWRGKFTTAAQIAFPLGALLIGLALIFPQGLVWPNKGWMLVAEALSFVTTGVILAIVYFLVVTPIGIVKRLSGWDPLHRRKGPAESYWKPYSTRQSDTRHFEKMF